MPRNYVPQRVAARVRRARTDAHLTQRELAEVCGTCFETVSRWENAHMVPRLEQMYDICNACGVQMGWLTGWDNDRKGE